MNKTILLEAVGLDFHIDDRQILQNISFQLYTGQTIAILGRSGMGKSTLLKILAGLLSPDRGKVLFRGQALQDPNEQLIPGHREIKLVNQDFRLDLFHNVEENLRIPLNGYTEKVKQELISEILDITALTSFEKCQARNLSGGEQQRLAIARALVLEPDVLLLDEPFSHLDAQLKTKIEQHIRKKINHWNSCVILVTHDGREAMSWADLIVFLEDGQFKRIDTPENFYNNPSDENEATHFGPINKIRIGKTLKLFRPNAYDIVPNGSIKLIKHSAKFLGTHYENWMKSTRNEDILLYSQNELAVEISIEPRYVGEK